MSEFSVERARQMFEHRQKMRRTGAPAQAGAQTPVPRRDGDGGPAARDEVGFAGELIGALHIVHSRLRRLDGWLRDEHQLNLTEMHVLSRLPTAPSAPLSGDGGYPAARLAEAVGLSPSGLTRLVDRLVRRGLLARLDDVWDKRVTHLALTERGRAVRDAVLPQALDRIRDCGPGHESLLEHLNRVVARSAGPAGRPRGR